MRSVRLSALAAGLLLVAIATGCGGEGRASDSGSAAPAASETGLSGKIEIDGSSTVGPMAQAAAEAFRASNPDVDVTVGVAGTGGGFERFCAGETDISNASRPIKTDPADQEASLCKQNGIEYTEFLVANDGISVVVNKENDWAQCLTVDQLKSIWEPKSKVTNWSQVDPSFPDEPIKLFGPGTDSGTFDFFTDTINGEEGASRSDYTASENDNTLVQGVAGEKGGLGYFGYSYFEENQDTLTAVQVDNGSGCVSPSPETVQSGEYAPLSRPLFMYVKNDSFTRPEVEAFMQYIIENESSVSSSAALISLTDEQQSTAQTELDQALQAAGA